MTVTEAMQARRSIRGYLPRPISKETLDDLFVAAQRAPSNCNVQPWQVHVVSGGSKDALRDALVSHVSQNAPAPDFGEAVMPRYQGVLQDRQYGAAAALYTAMGIDRSDKTARSRASLRNWGFFGAPHVAIFTMDRRLGLMGAVDVGIYAHGLALLMTERGIGSCMQASLGYFPAPIRSQLGLAEDCGILFGMSFGYRDEDVPANRALTSRATLGEVVRFLE